MPLPPPVPGSEGQPLNISSGGQKVAGLCDVVLSAFPFTYRPSPPSLTPLPICPGCARDPYPHTSLSVANAQVPQLHRPQPFRPQFFLASDLQRISSIHASVPVWDRLAEQERFIGL